MFEQLLLMSMKLLAARGVESEDQGSWLLDMVNVMRLG
jgi:hypothetical protein